MDCSSDLQLDPERRWPGQSQNRNQNPCCLLLLDQTESDPDVLVIAFVLLLIRCFDTSNFAAPMRRHGDARCGSVIVTQSCYYLVHFV